MPKDGDKKDQLKVTQKKILSAKCAGFDAGYHKEINVSGSEESCSQFMREYNEKDNLEKYVYAGGGAILAGIVFGGLYYATREADAVSGVAAKGGHNFQSGKDGSEDLRARLEDLKRKTGK
ncbi:hypothetical protein ACET7K_02285 [Aeromonas veronii]